MLIVTNKSYVYAEKYYKDAQLQSCLTFEIFKKQKLANINYNFIKYLIFSNLVENHGFDNLEFSKSLENKIYFHKWFEKIILISAWWFLWILIFNYQK